MPCTGGHFGGQAIELSGMAVHPRAQKHGLGTSMLKGYMVEQSANLLTTHTRNPALLRMLGSICGKYSIYPTYDSPSRQQQALQLPGSSLENDGVVYHVNRDGGMGLYGADDPADRSFDTRQSLKQRFPGLQQPGTALVVVAEDRPYVRRSCYDDIPESHT